MKKTVTLIFSAAMILSLAACSNGQPAGNTTSSSTTQATSTTQAEATTQPASSRQEGSTEAPAEATTEAASGQTQASGNGNILIAYFSVPETDGVDTVSGASRVNVDGEVLGNNQYLAQLIQQETGGDLFRIETVQEYPGTHDALLEYAYNELSDNARPELSTQIENLDNYDVIFLGYPKMEPGFACV